MLVHIFDNLYAEEEETCSRFLLHMCKASEIRSFRRDGEYLEIRVTTKDKRKKRKGTWSSGTLFQKLLAAPPKLSVPIIWRMGRYLHAGDNDTASDAVRSYLTDSFKIQLEGVPFTLERNSRLSTRCKTSRDQVPDELDDRKVKITVDKHDLSVTILPHRGLVQTLVSSLLKGFL